MASRVLYLFGCAAPPVFDVPDVIKTAQADGWDVCLGLTPTAARWLDDQLPDLAERTGHPVRSAYNLPGELDVWPPADVAVMAPATFNTLNQWALGITDHFVVGFAAEAIGKGIPLVTMPCVNLAFTAHPQFEQAIAALRGVGVEVLYGPGGFEPHPPGTGMPDGYPWHLALDAAARHVTRPA